MSQGCTGISKTTVFSPFRFNKIFQGYTRISKTTILKYFSNLPGLYQNVQFHNLPFWSNLPVLYKNLQNFNRPFFPKISKGCIRISEIFPSCTRISAQGAHISKLGVISCNKQWWYIVECLLQKPLTGWLHTRCSLPREMRKIHLSTGLGFEPASSVASRFANYLFVVPGLTVKGATNRYLGLGGGLRGISK